MRAELIYHEKWIEEVEIVEIKIWSVPKSKDKPHGYKYSLVYIKEGLCLIGYDNAESKGDHRHYGDSAESYRFDDLEKLFSDFYYDIRRLKDES
ncbi:MAG: DUF6516 family protein [Nitrospira sp.]|nr:DUF6516 family protein [Nitrospira sp.]